MPNNKRRNNQYGWVRATRDIVVSAINKGQLPLLGIIAIFLIIFLRMPEQHLSAILGKIVDHLITGELWAYPLLAVTFGAWFTHAKIMRTNFTFETNRISQEKSRLQDLLSKKNFPSSE